MKSTSLELGSEEHIQTEELTAGCHEVGDTLSTHGAPLFLSHVLFL